LPVHLYTFAFCHLAWCMLGYQMSFILSSLEGDGMESSECCVELLSLIFILKCRTKPVCFKHMLVSWFCLLYIRWRIHCIRDHTQALSAFPYGSTQHVRCMGSSIISVIHYVSTVLVESALLEWFWGLPSAKALNY